MRNLALIAAVVLVATAAPAFAMGPPDPPGSAPRDEAPNVNLYGRDGSYQGFGVSTGAINRGPPTPPGATDDNPLYGYNLYGRDGSYQGQGIGRRVHRGPPAPPRGW